MDCHSGRHAFEHLYHRGLGGIGSADRVTLVYDLVTRVSADSFTLGVSSRVDHNLSCVEQEVEFHCIQIALFLD